MATKDKSGLDDRSMAKWGMAASMGTLLVTGLMETKKGRTGNTMRSVHLWSGLALVGFSLWHYSLYQRKR
ncbi:hypothetical protein [Dethiosulfatarculus sandiegensis]|uniref:Uncharacterized protein n=1 Tax=Dethiosulfatarculus sandiegensis TaxID=1429043 RepID=A0A0D2K0S9_9BACT|nr:hypothetical protein [Dethiosulfatarculus sandiegensis]KIX15330.1 hypothetical protein X474_04145 [Dethiosulfatarculus sandiegensis]